MSTVGRLLTAFGRFWWDFLVGDTPEMLVATLVVVGVALGLRHHHWVDVVALPVFIVLVLVTSTLRGRRRRS